MKSITYESGLSSQKFVRHLGDKNPANGTARAQVEAKHEYLIERYSVDESIKAELAFEAGGYTEALERYQELQRNANSAHARHSQRLIVSLIDALSQAIQDRQDEAALDDSFNWQNRPTWFAPFLALDANKLAFITLNCALRGSIDGIGEKRRCALRTIMINIFETVKEQIEYENYASDTGIQLSSLKDTIERFKKRYYKKLNAKQWKWWQSKLHIQHSEWNEKSCFGLGAALIDVLLKALPSYFTKVYGVTDTNKRSLELHMTDDLRELMQNQLENYVFARPRYMPMIIPPRDWTYNGKGRLVGGYYLHNVDAITSTLNKHTAALDKPISAEDIEAMNFAQKTAWNINDRVYNVAVIELQQKTSLYRIENRFERLSKAEYSALTDDEKKLMKARMREARRLYQSSLSKRNAALNTLSCALRLHDFSEFYYPHFRDFRMRLYPIPTICPHPQGDDLSKGLIEFANGKMLGEHGFFWLCIRAANCYGNDKMTLDDRFQWVLDNRQLIAEIAANPENSELWVHADEPFQFLATCFELVEAFQWLDAGQVSEYVSYLPVNLDGSCNGLQHLSAMGLDSVGAKSVNLVSDDTRHDIYSDVATSVAELVQIDHQEGAEAAGWWTGHITRKTVKRSVMTTPYGVTARGISIQLIDDGFIPAGVPFAQWGMAASYLRDKILLGLEKQIQGARDIMRWFQDCADKVAKSGEPLLWATPSGSLIRMAYFESQSYRLTTLIGSLALAREIESDKMNVLKSKNSVSPNVIHSFDAAHMSKVIRRAVYNNIDSLSCVHDSFGSHACDMTMLREIIRQEFVEMYQDNPLMHLRGQWSERYPDIQFELPPERGNFDLNQVLESDFFFS